MYSLFRVATRKVTRSTSYSTRARPAPRVYKKNFWTCSAPKYVMLAGVGVVGLFSYSVLAPTDIRKTEINKPATPAALPTTPEADVNFRWVDVTSKNFDTELQRFRQLLPEAFMVSVDTEFTGLEADEKNKSSWSDSVAQRYKKSRDNCSQFMALQIGICLWTTNENQEYVAYPFNFYVMPKEKNFLVQSSSLRFLADNHYDFNKTISEGIPFLNLDEEATLKSKLIRTYDKIVIGPNEEILLNDLIKQISDWRDAAKPGEVLEMPSLTGFQRLLAYQEVDTRFDDIYLDSKRNGPQVILKVSKVTKEEKDNLNNKKTEAALKKIDDEVGFTKVMKSLTEKSDQFVIVGHNMFLDLLHFFDKFHKKLPQELPEFVSETHRLYPKVMDTKFIAINDPQVASLIKTTDLGFLHQNIATATKNENRPKITIPSNFGRDSGSGVYHQAGFDAFITGYVYLHMLHILGGNGFNRSSMLAFSPYMNKVNLSMARVPLELQPVGKSDK